MFGLITARLLRPLILLGALAIAGAAHAAPPIYLGGIPDPIVVDEDTAGFASFDPFFEDPEGGVLFFSILSINPFGIVDVSSTGPRGSVISYAGFADQNGLATVDLQIQDIAGEILIYPLNIEVTPVPDAPELIQPLQDQFGAEDQYGPVNIDLDIHFSDPDGDALTYNVDDNSKPEVVNVSIAGNIMTLVGEPNGAGISVVNICANDGVLPEVCSRFDVDLVAIDDPPINIGNLPDLVIDEDESPIPSVDLTTIFEDVDSTLSYAINISPPGLIVMTTVGDELQISAAPNVSGTGTYEVIATGDGIPVSQVHSITVNAVPDDPRVSNPLGTLIVQEDQATVADLDLNGHFIDDDGVPLTYSFTESAPGTITINLSGSILSFSTIPDQFGTTQVTVTATNADGPPVSDILTIEVQEQNDPPVRTGTAPLITMDEDQATALPTLDLDTLYTDIDSPTLAYTIVSVTPTGIVTPTITGSILEFTQTANAFGSVTLEVAAKDELSPADLPSTINVVVNPTNDDPVVDGGLGTVVIGEDSGTNGPFTLVGAFGDIDGDALSYTIVSISPATELTASISGDSLFLTTEPDQNDTTSVVIEATDGIGTPVQDTLTVDITDLPDPPRRISDIADIVAQEDTAIASIDLTAIFEDPDGDALVYSIASNSNPPILGATISGSTLNLSPNANFAGVTTIRVEATESSGQFAFDEFEVDLQQVNDAPVVIVPSPAIFEEDTAGTLTAMASDWFDDVDLPYGDVLGYSVTNIGADPVFTPGSVSIDGAGVLSFTLAENESGFGDIEVTVTDTAGETAVVTFRVIVNAVNDPPYEQSPLPTQIALEDAPTAPTFSLVGVFGDDDIGFTGDILTYQVISTSNPLLGTFSVSGDDVVMSQTLHEIGTTIVVVEAMDRDGETALSSFEVQIDPTNDPPFAAVPPPGLIQVPEDASNAAYPLAAYFDDVDLTREGDSFTSPLFNSITVVGDDLVLNPSLNSVGFHTVQVVAIDQNGTGLTSPPVDVPLEVLLVIVIAEPDTATTDEGTPIVIDVLANDTLGDPVTEIILAGITVTLGDTGVFEGVSESAPTAIVDATGVSLLEPNARVDIQGGTILYTPKPGFNGVDFFHYTARDGDGDESSARVDVTVVSQNEAPVANVPPRFDMFQGNALDVLAEGGLADMGFDGDGDPLTVLYLTVPDPLTTMSFVTNPDGSFTYAPDPSFSGVATFDIQYQDPAGEVSAVVTVEIDVAATPPPPAAPPPGEVEFDMNLSDVPLEDAISTEANVLVVMDDSGSMDWDMMTNQSSGVFRLSNGTGGRSGGIRGRGTWFYYIYRLPTNVYNRPVAPTEETVVENSYAVAKQPLWCVALAQSPVQHHLLQSRD